MFNPVERERFITREPIAALEGAYTTWTHLWTLIYPNTLAVFTAATWRVDDINEILYLAWEDQAPNDRFGTWNIRTGANIFTSPLGVNYPGTAGAASLIDMATDFPTFYYGSSREIYTLIGRNDGFTVEIWTNGALLFSINIQLVLGLGRWMDTISMSRIGKWVLVSSLNDLLIYEGA